MDFLKVIYENVAKKNKKKQKKKTKKHHSKYIYIYRLQALGNFIKLYFVHIVKNFVLKK